VTIANRNPTSLQLRNLSSDGSFWPNLAVRC
jgi:hypothetical protein